MTLIVDAGALFAQANHRDPSHGRMAHLLQTEPGPFVTSELVLAEADYLILDRLGVEAELTFLATLARGFVTVDCLAQPELMIAYQLVERYRDLRLGLAGCSLVVLAYRYESLRIATLNERHFRAVRPLQGGSFALLPADA